MPYFYEQVGQYLRAYVAPPPPLRNAASAEETDEPLEKVAEDAETAASEATDDTQIMVSSTRPWVRCGRKRVAGRGRSLPNA